MYDTKLPLQLLKKADRAYLVEFEYDVAEAPKTQLYRGYFLVLEFDHEIEIEETYTYYNDGLQQATRGTGQFEVDTEQIKLWPWAIYNKHVGYDFETETHLEYNPDFICPCISLFKTYPQLEEIPMPLTDDQLFDTSDLMQRLQNSYPNYGNE
jgi:hypothetical protein